MRTHTHLSRLFIIMLCGLMMALPFAALAQDNGDENGDDVAVEVDAEVEADADTDTDDESVEAGDENGDDVPQGIGTLMLLLGIGCVGLVGMAFIARDNFKDEDTE